MNQRDRLIKLIEDYTENVTTRELHSQHFDEKFADHLLANGVNVPPCKSVGDKLYFHQFNRSLEKVVVEGTIVEPNDTGYIVKLADGRKLTFLFDFIGKTVFLTREEAEKALEEMKNEL